MDFLFNSLAAPDPASPPPEPEAAGSASPPPDAPGGGGWGFGGLLKTLSSQSETVLEAYRRDLAEFSTGLRRETDAFREAAARAARDLPSSAHALDGLADIVAQGKDAIAQAAAAASASAPSDGAPAADSDPASASGHLRYYSRFEAQLRALQSDPATFTADPDDAEDFAAWRSAGFSLDERQEEIEALCYESDAMEGMVDRLVPDAVESEVFWARYFYRVHRLQQQEDARAKLVKRVIAQEEEEDLSWEVDDEVEEESAKEEAVEQASIKEEPKHEATEREEEKLVEQGRVEAAEESGALDKETKNADAPPPEVFGSSMVVVDKEEKEDASTPNVEEPGDKKTVAEEPHSTTGDDAVKEVAKHETSDSSKDSDYSLVSRQRTATDEDLEWDEIEDLGEHEEKESTHGSSPAPKEELRKRLSVAEDDEDLSWDIEDDDDKA